MAISHADMLLQLEQLEKMELKHNRHIELIFEYLKQFEKTKQEELDFKNRPRIGFKPSNRI